MANEEFGLGFTVEQFAFFNDKGPEAGQIGEASTISANVLTYRQVGEPSTIFAELTIPKQIGEATTIFAELTIPRQIGEATTFNPSGICFKQNLLSARVGTFFSVLSSSGQNVLRTC